MHFEGSSDTDQFHAHLDRGWDLISRGDTAGALLSARKGVELDAESPEAHNLLAYVLAAGGNAEEALEHYREAIDLDDTFVDAMLNAADILLRPVGDPDAALQLIDDALELIEDDQELADALLLKVDTMLIRGDAEGARRALRRVPEKPTLSNPMISFLVGRAYFELGEPELAAPRLEAAAAHESAHADVHYYWALLREKQGEAQSATIAFLRVRELDLAEARAPWSIPTDKFEGLLRDVLSTLEAKFGGSLDGALVHVSDAPGPEAVADGVDPRACALFDLGTAAERVSSPSETEKSERRLPAVPTDDTPVGRRARPAILFVYQRNIERIADDIGKIRDVLEQAVIHELEGTGSQESVTGGSPASAAIDPPPPQAPSSN